MLGQGYVEAQPRTAEEIAGLPRCPEVVDAAVCRGVSQVVHFTTIRGALGVLASGAVKCRERLPKDDYLEHVYKPNAVVRKDPRWLDYVNLSIERINEWMFKSSVRWHSEQNNPWVVLSFHPRMLGDPGVVFTTTNNIYPSCRRTEGLNGFRHMFAEETIGRYGAVHNRANKPAAWPTDRQAEVLYPGELSCDHLKRIDVQREESLDTIRGILEIVPIDVPVRHAPEVFK